MDDWDLLREYSANGSQSAFEELVGRHVNFVYAAIKTEKRRRKHESNRVNVMKQQDEEDADWETLAPHLDAALSKLSAGDRDALLLRFFSAKSHREIAAQLGVSEETARKRAFRAVNRLREVLLKRGVAVGAITLTALWGYRKKSTGTSAGRIQPRITRAISKHSLAQRVFPSTSTASSI
jgi:hypothetical protein